MTKTVKLFLPNEFHEEMLYQYEDKDADLRKLIFGLLKPLGKQGVMIKLNKTMQGKVKKNDKTVIETIELKNINLDETTVGHNPDWIPEKVTREEIKIYELTVSDRLYDDLVHFGKVYCAGIKLHNNTLDKEAPPGGLTGVM